MVLCLKVWESRSLPGFKNHISYSMKNIIVITGGAGFVGSNLIEYFINKTKLKIISLDNYSSGTIKNHIKSSRVKYIKSNTKKILVY